MNEEIVNKQLEQDYNNFLFSVYNGKVAIPEDILDLFKTAILAIPSFAHKIPYEKIKFIYKKEVHQLTHSDLNEIIKVILNIPAERLYPYLEFEDVIEKGIEIDNFVKSYNSEIEQFKKKLDARKKSLTDITSGVRGNGLKIIPNG